MEVILQRTYCVEQLRHQMCYIQKTEEQVARANQQLDAVVMENSWYVLKLLLDFNCYIHSLLQHIKGK